MFGSKKFFLFSCSIVFICISNISDTKKRKIAVQDLSKNPLCLINELLPALKFVTTSVNQPSTPPIFETFCEVSNT